MSWCSKNYSCNMSVEKNKLIILKTYYFRGMYYLDIKDYDNTIIDLEKAAKLDSVFILYVGEIYFKKLMIATYTV